jgi:hypothetical protein
MSAGPGFPWNTLANDNKKLLDKHRDVVVDAVIKRVRLLAGTPSLDDFDAVQLVAEGYTDPVRMFVKNEPHTTVKASTGRWRLIASVSIVDQLIERLLCGLQNEKEIRNYLSCPSAPGMGLGTDEQLADLGNHLLSLGPIHTLSSMDFSGFDMSVKYWNLVDDAKVRVCLNRTAGTVYERLLLNRVRCLGLSLYVLPDGRAIAQLSPGVQLSGSYNTSSTNSRMRVMMALHAGVPAAIAMGDDCIERTTQGAQAWYEAHGYKVKFNHVFHDTLEFCSHEFHYKEGRFSKAFPTDPSRTLFRILNQTSKDTALEAFVSLRMTLRHHPRCGMIIPKVAEDLQPLGLTWDGQTLKPISSN